MAVFGYARVSTTEQDTALQVDALHAFGVPTKNIVTEKVSGAAKHKPALAALLDRLADGDTLVVWKVDRLGRSVMDALQTVQRLDAAGVRIVITTLGIDLKTSAGRLVFGIMAQLAEFERETIKERVTAGIAAAKARGKVMGRRHTLSPHQRAEAARLIGEGQTYAQVAALFGCGRTIVFAAVQEAKAKTLPA